MSTLYFNIIIVFDKYFVYENQYVAYMSVAPQREKQIREIRHFDSISWQQYGSINVLSLAVTDLVTTI